MYAANFPSVSDAGLHLNFDVGEFDFTANAIDGQSMSSQLCSQVASAGPKLVQYSVDSASSQEETADTTLPSDWGIRILSLLSKDRTQAAAAQGNTSPSESINGDCCQQPSEQNTLELSDQPAEQREQKQRDKNKRAQKRHRERLKVMEFQSSSASTLRAESAQTCKCCYCPCMYSAATPILLCSTLTSS